MSNYSNAADGLVTILQNNITGLHAFNHPPAAVQDFPAAIVLPELPDPIIAFGGNSFTGRFRIVLLVTSADTYEGFRLLYDHLDPTEANASVIKAVRTDRTLNGNVDDADVVAIENVGRRAVFGGEFFGFDAIVEFIKTVA